MRRFNAQRPVPELVSAVHLFELAEAPGTPGSERLAGMIAFAARYATAQGRADLLELLGPVGEGLARPEDAETLVRFLADGARQTGHPVHRELAFRAWLSIVQRHVVGRGQGLEAAKSAWSCLPGPDPDTAAQVLQDPLWHETGGAALRSLSSEALAFLFQVLWRCLEITGRTPAWSQPEIEALVRSAASNPLSQALLAAVPRQPEALTAVSRLLAAAWTPADTGRALGRVLAAGDLSEANAVRRQLAQAGDFEILMGEWLEIRDRARQPLAAFEEYRRSVLTPLPELERRCDSRIRSSLLDILPESERVPLALSWLRDESASRRFPAELASRCLALANLAVPLDLEARDGDDIAQRIAGSATTLGVALRPDRPLLRNILKASREPQTPFAALRLDDVRGAMQDLRPEEYETFLAGFLRPALGRAGTRGEHQKVLLATFATPHARTFERCYQELFEVKRKTSWPEELHAALRFWLAFDSGREELRPLASIEGAARKGLVVALSRLKPERLDAVRQNLKKSRLDPRSSSCWRGIEDALEARKRGPWTRFVSLFARSEKEKET